MRNEEVYESFRMAEMTHGMQCGVFKWVKRSALMWYRHARRMPKQKLTKKIYQSIASGVAGRV